MEGKSAKIKHTPCRKTPMKTSNFLTSSCRFCRYYQTEGRRGGMCQQLGVPVRAEWKACSLAAAPFTHTWESLEKVVKLENSLVLEYPNDAEEPKKINAFRSH
ncbi:hypothetical protein cce_1182 [Crocosphaera subtropica ATCC 51142]|uniref:Uncharacterized protein n=2 Tax=Crocosphaera TaxID=263510 RepID=B1WUT1_CROS5|nr:hypothetical protein cce_1182 [Crocosphaera subtropica ATCC 51142]